MTVGDQSDALTPEETRIYERLRDSFDQAPASVVAKGRAALPKQPPCLYRFLLENGAGIVPNRYEWCRISSVTPHTIHVSQDGHYRWADDGFLIDTPHFSSVAFTALYEQDPTGQLLWDGLAPAAAGPHFHDPKKSMTGFQRFAWTWRQYGNLPPAQRWIRRAFHTMGFGAGLLLMAASAAALAAAVLAVAWFMVAYFARWLTT